MKLFQEIPELSAVSEHRSQYVPFAALNHCHRVLIDDRQGALTNLHAAPARCIPLLQPAIERESFLTAEIQTELLSRLKARRRKRLASSCQGVGVRGIRFDVENPEPELRSWYIGDGVPRVDATMTNNIGSGGIFNVSEGFKVALATRVSDNIPVARAEAPVRAGFMTIVVFAPLATSD